MSLLQLENPASWSHETTLVSLTCRPTLEKLAWLKAVFKFTQLTLTILRLRIQAFPHLFKHHKTQPKNFCSVPRATLSLHLGVAHVQKWQHLQVPEILGTKISMLPGISSKNLGCQGTSALPITTTTGRCSPRKATEMDAKQMVFNLGIFVIFYGLKPQGLEFADFLPGNLPTICWALAPRSCKAWVKSTAFRLTRLKEVLSCWLLLLRHEGLQKQYWSWLIFTPFCGWNEKQDANETQRCPRNSAPKQRSRTKQCNHRVPESAVPRLS